MDTNFIESIQEKLKTERSEIVRSLSAQSDDMKNLIKPQESGDEVDVASVRLKEFVLAATEFVFHVEKKFQKSALKFFRIL